MALFIYGTATNYGKDFFTHQDRRNFFLAGYPAEVWVVGNNEKGALWLAERNGVEKTKTEAQALVTADVEAAQAAWDALSEADRGERERPGDVTIP
tara:strand:+ start:288 stop:575 length:288 start_codon:yes stop_codon:yes gene_type:complete